MAGDETVQRVSPDMLMEAMDAVTDGVPPKEERILSSIIEGK